MELKTDDAFTAIVATLTATVIAAFSAFIYRIFVPKRGGYIVNKAAEILENNLHDIFQDKNIDNSMKGKAFLSSVNAIGNRISSMLNAFEPERTQITILLNERQSYLDRGELVPDELDENIKNIIIIIDKTLAAKFVQIEMDFQQIRALEEKTGYAKRRET